MATSIRPVRGASVTSSTTTSSAGANQSGKPILRGSWSSLSFGGWIWRYDLEASGPSSTTITLTYDWSAVPPEVREQIPFPPFAEDHLANSLHHLSALAVAT